ncbi:MAG: tRNA pseudouridine(38-40) synthase TruA, partial [Lactobacillus sp.]|nr:tRNA pseudouridine(38-40) synthase TruA [Lactobacillus sp.]
MTTRYKMTIAYDGHLFHGFQSQPHQRTVQGTVEAALKKMTKG